ETRRPGGLGQACHGLGAAMKTWVAAGEIVREWGCQFFSDFARYELKSHDICILTMPVPWLASCFVGAYDPGQFDYREWLRANPAPADYYEDKNGRPRGDASRAAALTACYLYSAWRNQNRKLEVDDYGHRRDMKDFAATAVVEDIFAVQFETPKLA